MAVINQSPAGQASVALSGIAIDNLDVSGTPFWRGVKIVGSPSVEMRLGGDTGPAIPTTGQIWPLGIY
jgi:hypothetical protein